MEDLSFSQIFPNGSQDINTWVINKADLPGLTASLSNSPGSLLTALVLAFWYQNQPQMLTDSGDVITCDSGDIITCDALDIFTDIQTIYWQLNFQNFNNLVYRYDNLVVFSYAAISSS